MSDLLRGDYDDGSDDLLGRALPKRRAPSAGNQGGARTVGQQLSPTEQRRNWTPVGNLLSPAAGASVTLTVSVQRVQQGDRLVIVSDAARCDMVVTDIKCGVRSQFNAAGQAPVEAWREDAVVGLVDMDPTMTGQDLFITVLNRGAGAADVAAVLLGASAQ